MRITLPLIAILLHCTSLFGQAIDPKFTENFKQTQKKSAFQENKGQMIDQNGNLRPDIKYSYNAPGLKVHFKADGWSYETYKLEEKQELSEATLKPITEDNFPIGKEEPNEYTVHTHRVDIVLPNANPNVRFVTENALEDYINFYTYKTPEEGILNVKSYSKITYKNIWNNIDIEWIAEKEGELKYNIILHPGANPKDIKMAYFGSDRLLLENGKLKTSVSFALASSVERDNLTESIPAVFGADAANFTINNKTIGFELAGWNQTTTAIIDPQIIWGTYYGGTDDDRGNDIILDSVSNIFLTGNTLSSSNISTSGSHQTSIGGNRDAIVVKFNNNGVRLWATYLGGSSSEESRDIQIDNSGNIYITGLTESSSNISTFGAHQTIIGGNDDAFIIKFNNNGVRQWGTYYGGTLSDRGACISTDGIGNIYVVGYTSSSNNISTNGSFQNTYGGGGDCFTVKFNTNGIRTWATYYGGSSFDFGRAVDIDSTGNVFISGNTASTSNISTIGAHQTTSGGNFDAFLVKFNSIGVRQWGTYYGGNGDEFALDIVTDKIGNLFLTGQTGSTNNISTNGALQTSNKGNIDAYVVKFNNNGVRQWGTYYGGNGEDWGNKIEIDSFGNIFIIGHTSSTSDISTPNVYQTSNNGNFDAFIVKLNKNGMRQWGTYFGGNSNDLGNDFAIDLQGNMYVCGYTSSLNNVSSLGAYQTSNGGNNDAFLVKFEEKIDIKTIVIDEPKNKVFCKNDSFQPQVNILNQGISNINNFYYRFQLQGSIKSIDSILVDTLKPNIQKTINLGKYFVLNTSGNSTLKVYPSYADDTASNDTLIFNFNVNPITIAGTTSGTATVCSGFNSGNISLAGNTGNVVKWQFSTNDGSSWSDIANTTTTQAYNNLTTTTLYRAIVQSGVCSQDTSNATTITVDPVSVAGTTSGAATVCSGSNSGNINLTGNTGNVVKWQFSTNGGSSWTDITNTTTTHAYNNLTTTTLYRAIVQSGVCSPDTSNNTMITVDSETVAGTTSGSETFTTIINSGVIRLNNYLGNIVKWQSSNDGGSQWSDISNTNDSLTYSNLEKTTEFRAVVKNGVCSEKFSSISTVLIDTTTNISSLKNSQFVKVYPNPNEGSFTVELPEVACQGCMLRMYDLQGKEVLQRSFLQGEKQIIISQSGLAKGTYLLKLIDSVNLKEYTSKVVVN
jgi:hypothetical protein